MTRYFDRRLAADVLEVRRASLEDLNRHLEDARRLKKEGQIARTDELHAEVARAEADRDFKKARRDVELASIALASTLGADLNVTPTTPLVLIADLEPRETFLDKAGGNPSVARLGALRDEAHQGVVAARLIVDVGPGESVPSTDRAGPAEAIEDGVCGELLPSVSLFGTYELFDRGTNATADPKWMVGVLARWELFDGFARVNKRRAAQHAESALALQQDWAQRNVSTGRIFFSK